MMNDVTKPRPVQPLQPKVIIEQRGESLRVSYRRREWATGGGLIFWLILWTVGCVFLVGVVMREPTLVHFLFAIPFWASWFFVLALLPKIFFQWEEFLLDSAGAVFSRRVFIETKRRATPLQEIKRFGIYERIVDSETGSTESGIEMETFGQPLEFAAGLANAELLWLQDLLQQQLVDLRKRLHIEPPLGDLPSQSDGCFNSDSAKPPSDCRWQREDDFDALTFCQSGQISWTAVGFLLFISLFWNGIVSVFVCALFGLVGKSPQDSEWWWMFLFLIPFEVIGLIVLAGLLLVILEPVRRTSWKIGRWNIVCRLTWFGIGPAWDYSIERLARIQLNKKEPPRKKYGKPATVPWKSADATYRLSFVDKSNREVCSIDSLTEGEAHWMADIIRRERLTWFR